LVKILKFLRLKKYSKWLYKAILLGLEKIKTNICSIFCGKPLIFEKEGRIIGSNTRIPYLAEMTEMD